MEFLSGDDSDGCEVWRVTQEEWDRAKANALAELGITWEELTEQARHWDYQSTEARMVWLTFKDY